MKIRIFFLSLTFIFVNVIFSNHYDSLFHLFMSSPTSFKTKYFSASCSFMSEITHSGQTLISNKHETEIGEIEFKELLDNNQNIAYLFVVNVNSKRLNIQIKNELSNEILNKVIYSENEYQETYTYEFVNILDTNATLFRKGYKPNVNFKKFEPQFLYILSPFSGEKIGSSGGFASRSEKTSELFFKTYNKYSTDELILLFNSSNYYIRVLSTLYYYMNKKEYKLMPKLIKNEFKKMKNNETEFVYVHYSGCTVINRLRLVTVKEALKSNLT